MTRLFQAGAEWNGGEADGWTGIPGAAGSVAAGAARTGNYGLRISNGAGAWTKDFTGATGRSYYARCYVKFSANPNAASQILVIKVSAVGATLAVAELTTSGTLRLLAGASQVGSPSGTLSTATWYRVELRVKIGTGATDELELRYAEVGGTPTTVASSTTESVSDTAPGHMTVGGSMAASQNLDFDDVALNDDQGSLRLRTRTARGTTRPTSTGPRWRRTPLPALRRTIRSRSPS
jgi:hypothetical protein